MSETIETKLPCPTCASSDAFALYDDGHGHCFSCDTTIQNVDEGERSMERAQARRSDSGGVPLIRDLMFNPLKKRGISQETVKIYGYGIDAEGRQVAPYCNEKGRVVAQKVRTKDKDFLVTGKLKDAVLFGQQKLRAGGKMVVITEGEIDAMSVTEVMGKAWPALSVPNGAAGAAKALAAQLEYLESFERVVLCFDNDKAGAEALDECVALFSPGKVAIANLGEYKDANAMLQDGMSSELRDAIWGAQVYRPDGVINMADAYDRVRKPLSMGMEYPWPRLNELLFGFRPGEVITWCAGTGVGKSALVSEVVYHAIAKLQVPTGIIYLEEGIDRAGKRLVGLAMDKPLHLPSAHFTKAEFDKAWAETLGTGRLFAYDHFGSLDEAVLLNSIRYMVKACACKLVVLDHISMVVSGADLDGDERRMLDHIMTNFKSLMQETEAAGHVVSHLRRPPGSGSHEEGRQVSLSHLRGTQAIAQLSDAVIAAERDQQAATEPERNTTQLRVLKNRYAGLTGPADQLLYAHDTGRLVPITEEETHDNADDY